MINLGRRELLLRGREKLYRCFAVEKYGPRHFGFIEVV